ncbi:MAG: hypothetical protein WC934_11640 [Acidithiobacillus sp.]|jgi:hypothetical protein|uniref:hypothetical protein n=1 Tax=Acidithiobacillus sp. TaxID=1872118 RepID=UPI0035602016
MPLRILHLCDKQVFQNKMSRVRFHSMTAISKVTDLITSGPKWDGFESVDQIEQRVKPDLIIWYQPFGIKNYDKAIAPTCLRYNEMYDINKTINEIKKSNTKLVICHHKNDMNFYIKEFPNLKTKFYNISHCAEKTLFKDYKLQKTTDLLLVGVLNSFVYPFRSKLKNILKIMEKNYICKIYPHPSYILENADNNLHIIDFAKAINSAKITLTCSSQYKYLLGKYIEVPMCNSLLAADIPDDDNYKDLQNLMINLKEDDSYEIIISKLTEFLKNPELIKELSLKGYKYAINNCTHENYAIKFINIVEEFLKTN